jgi:hypothetical protein
MILSSQSRGEIAGWYGEERRNRETTKPIPLPVHLAPKREKMPRAWLSKQPAHGEPRFAWHMHWDQEPTGKRANGPPEGEREDDACGRLWFKESACIVPTAR